MLSLLVEGALICDSSELTPVAPNTGYVRKPIRGQNLDRAGLTSRHMKLMQLVSEPTTTEQLSRQLGWPTDETQRVLNGFELAELIEPCHVAASTKVFGVVQDGELIEQLGSLFANQDGISSKIRS